MAMLLQEMKFFDKIPVILRAYKIGAIFMARNVTATSCIKHLGIWYKYVNKYTKNRIVEIVFFKSTRNDSDILDSVDSSTRSMQRKWYVSGQNN